MESIALLLTLVLGLVFAGVFLPSFAESLRARRWTRVRGTVTGSFIAEGKTVDGPSSYAPEIQYTYEFEGRKFFGERISVIGTSAQHRGHAREVLARYPVGASVDVYVDPRKPSRAVLEPGVSWGSLLATVMGLAFATFAVLMWMRPER